MLVSIKVFIIIIDISLSDTLLSHASSHHEEVHQRLELHRVFRADVGSLTDKVLGVADTAHLAIHGLTTGTRIGACLALMRSKPPLRWFRSIEGIKDNKKFLNKEAKRK